MPVQLDDVVQAAADFANRYHVRENIELAFGEVARLSDPARPQLRKAAA